MRMVTEWYAWRLPARAIRRRPFGLTARRFVDLGRTESMMCQLTAR